MVDLSRFSVDDRGQGLVEYLVLLCVICVAAIGVVSIVGQNIREQYANISHALQGERRIQMTRPDEKTYRKRGMDDFMEASE